MTSSFILNNKKRELLLTPVEALNVRIEIVAQNRITFN